MRASMLGLMVATAALAGTSVYLWRQVGEQRQRAEAAEQAMRDLSVRIGHEQPAHYPYEQRRSDVDAGFASAKVAPPRMPPLSAITSEAGKTGEAPPEHNSWSLERREPPPAMKRMMRANMRTFNRRLYADAGEALGIDKETALKLADLLTDQQFAGFDQQAADPNDPAVNWEDVRRQQEKAIADLIGPDKVASLREYQQSMPARQEFDMLSQQFANSDMPLTQQQSKQLLDVYVAERARVPMPTYTAGMDGAEFSKSMNAWQTDYAQRVSDEANHILNPEQLTAYNEIQQWQKDMREQMPAVLPLSGGAHAANGPRFSAVYVNGDIAGTAVGAVAAPVATGKSNKQ